MNAETKVQAASPHVYQAICEVQAELAKTGIAKSRKNDQQGYKFRGIDEVYAIAVAVFCIVWFAGQLLRAVLS